MLISSLAWGNVECQEGIVMSEGLSVGHYFTKKEVTSGSERLKYVLTPFKFYAFLGMPIIEEETLKIKDELVMAKKIRFAKGVRTEVIWEKRGEDWLQIKDGVEQQRKNIKSFVVTAVDILWGSYDNFNGKKITMLMAGKKNEDLVLFISQDYWGLKNEKMEIYRSGDGIMRVKHDGNEAFLRLETKSCKN